MSVARGRLVVLAVAIAAAVGVIAWASRRAGVHAAPALSVATERTQKRKAQPARVPIVAPAAPVPPAASGQLSAEKTARVDKIKRDYEELAVKLGEAFAADAVNFPGGMNAYLRQLVLLEREKRADYAAVLTPAELEDLEFRETHAGKAVHGLLSEPGVSDEQRRAVFRLQREFDDAYSLSFDLSPAGLLRRQTDHIFLQEKILDQLGPEKFALWLRKEAPQHKRMAEYLATQGLPVERSVEVWRMKSRYQLRHLEIRASSSPDEQQAEARKAAAAIARGEIQAILGSAVIEAAPRGIFDWLQGQE